VKSTSILFSLVQCYSWLCVFQHLLLVVDGLLLSLHHLNLSLITLLLWTMIDSYTLCQFDLVILWLLSLWNQKFPIFIFFPVLFNLNIKIPCLHTFSFLPTMSSSVRNSSFRTYVYLNYLCFYPPVVSSCVFQVPQNDGKLLSFFRKCYLYYPSIPLVSQPK
jgi:hypothetical protein